MKNLTWQNPEQLFVAQVLINQVKSKCCGIKDVYIYNTMGVLIYKSRNYKDEVIPLKRGQYLVKINEKTIKIIY